MSHENMDLTRNEPLPGGGAPFLYMQGDPPPGGSGGTRPEPPPPPPDDEGTKPTEQPLGGAKPMGDPPPGGSGGDQSPA